MTLLVKWCALLLPLSVEKNLLVADLERGMGGWNRIVSVTFGGMLVSNVFPSPILFLHVVYETTSHRGRKKVEGLDLWNLMLVRG